MNVAIVGMGGMGWFHASKYLQMPQVNLVAIADITPDRLDAERTVQINIAGDNRSADLSAVRRYADASRLIAEENVDVVDVCLPTFLHARYTIEALQHGRNVLCEKPMALTLDEAQAMIDAAGQAGKLLMIAQCIRFWPEYRFLRDCVRDERFGKLLSLSLTRIGGKPIWSWQNWFLDPARSGGPIQDLHIHDVDFVNYLLGKPDRLFCTARRSDATGAYDVMHTVFDYTHGPQVHLHAGWSNVQTPFVASYDAWFERGFIRADPRLTPGVQVFDDMKKAEGRPAEFDNATDAYYNEIAYFLDCVAKGNAPTECPPQSARDSLGLLSHAIASVESGQVVKP